MPDKNQPKKKQDQEWGKSNPGNQPGSDRASKSDKENMYGEKRGQQQQGNAPQKNMPYDPDKRGI